MAKRDTAQLGLRIDRLLLQQAREMHGKNLNSKVEILIENMVKNEKS